MATVLKKWGWSVVETAARNLSFLVTVAIICTHTPIYSTHNISPNVSIWSHPKYPLVCLLINPCANYTCRVYFPSLRHATIGGMSSKQRIYQDTVANICWVHCPPGSTKG